KLLFSSGLCKLTSGDHCWRDLTALQYHYYTQPIPNAVSWFAQQLPYWFQHLSVIAVFALELVLPTGIFLGRSARLVVALGTALLMLLIMVTGNYAFFNILTLALAV